MSDIDFEPPGEEFLVVGRIVRPHGVRGAVIVAVESDWPDERFREGAELLLQTGRASADAVRVESAAPHKGAMLVCLAGVTDRNGAEALKGRFLLVRAQEAFTLGEGEYWAHELVDARVFGEDGGLLGSVRDVVCREAQDLLVVVDAEGREFGVPFVEEFVKRVDVRERTVVIKVIEGMVP